VVDAHRVDSQPVHPIDISIGGALFSHGIERPLRHNRTVEVAYRGSDGTGNAIPAVVRRVWTPSDKRGDASSSSPTASCTWRRSWRGS
jgi:hypothetical protein